MARRALLLIIVTVASAGLSAAQSGSPRPAVPEDAVAAIIEAFDTHDIVALSEGTHGNEQGEAFRLSLIRDPRFAVRVNDIVLEGPNARYQEVMDRYVRGEDVPVASLRRVWDETTQQQAGGPMWTGEVPEFYRAVRQLNATLAPEHRLRLLLGDPPIDWEQIRTKGDPAQWVALRDTFPANLIEREVLAKHHRALLVFGNMHFQRKNLLANYESAGDGVVATVVSALEQAGRKTNVFS